MLADSRQQSRLSYDIASPMARLERGGRLSPIGAGRPRAHRDHSRRCGEASPLAPTLATRGRLSWVSGSAVRVATSLEASRHETVSPAAGARLLPRFDTALSMVRGAARGPRGAASRAERTP
jgi:hypothetical protein